MTQTTDGRRRLLDLAAGRKVKSPTDVVDLTDSSTGSAGDTIADGTASYSQSITNDNNASLAAKINAIRQELEDLGILQ
jgi:hypothetical protein